MIKFNRMTTIELKLDVIMNIMKNQEIRNHSVNEMRVMNEVSKTMLLIKD